MSVLKKYTKPSKEDLARMTLEEVEEIDEKNQLLYKKNVRLTEAAKAVALEVDPTNKQIRELQFPPPQYKVRVLWDQIREALKKAERQKG